jgi:AraC-like DNA-binding protein
MTSWATAIFPFENYAAEVDVVERVWRTRSVEDPTFISVAVPHWEMVFVRGDRAPRVFVRGPETRATLSEIPRDSEFVGVQFRVGVFAPNLPLACLVDRAVELRATSPTTVWLDGRNWEIPTFDNISIFLRRLRTSGLVVQDGLVEDAMVRSALEVSERTVQRRILRATGLSYGAIRQMRRAERVGELLQSGVSILDIVEIEGYADQAHLTRSIRRFLGVTPRELQRTRP